MLVVHVFVHVKEECIAAFIKASNDNASHSRLESGIARFDLVQQKDDASRFVLVEAYKTADAPALHKKTAHYARWRDAVADMMASPRNSIKYESLSPAEAEW